jgi:hypothetical protein
MVLSVSNILKIGKILISIYFEKILKTVVTTAKNITVRKHICLDASAIIFNMMQSYKFNSVFSGSLCN